MQDYETKVFEDSTIIAQGGSGSTLEARLTATPDNGTAPLEVLLDASGSTPKDEIVEYKFDRDGNGSFEYTETPANHPDGVFDGKTTHTYYTKGNHIPTVTVSDAQNRADTAEANVVVYQLNTITIQPGPIDGKDAYVDVQYWPEDPPTYHGYDTTFLEVNSFGAWVDEALIQFPLSSIPYDANIVSSKLKLYGQGAFLDELATVSVREIIGPWNESTVRWDTKPPYGDYVSSSILTDELKWHEFDVTPLVQSWRGGTNNYGLALTTLDQRPSWEYAFKSSDYSDSSKRPKLEVVYSQTQ